MAKTFDNIFDEQVAMYGMVKSNGVKELPPTRLRQACYSRTIGSCSGWGDRHERAIHVIWLLL